MPLCCGSLSNLQEELGVLALGALKLAGNVDDPLTWCGAAWMIFVQGTWRPHSLVEPGIKVTVIVFTEET